MLADIHAEWHAGERRYLATAPLISTPPISTCVTEPAKWCRWRSSWTPTAWVISGQKPSDDSDAGDGGEADQGTITGSDSASTPEVISGTITDDAGRPIPDAPVGLYVMGSEPQDGTASQRLLLQTVTTDGAGTWSYTMPSQLPLNIQPYADGNGGILNLAAVAQATSPDGHNFSVAQFVSGVTPSAEAQSAVANSFAKSYQPPTTAMLPDPDPETVNLDAGNNTVHDLDSFPTAADSYAASPTWQDDGSVAAGYNPDVVAVSTDGEDWTAGGSEAHGESTDITTSMAYLGPDWARQYQVPIKCAHAKPSSGNAGVFFSF